MTNKEKRQMIARSILQCFKKGTVTNISAQQLLLEANNEVFSNHEIIQNISEKMSELSPLTQEDAIILRDVFRKYKLLDKVEESVTQHLYHKPIWLNDSLNITDLSPIDQEQNDEYEFILSSSHSANPAKRTYWLQSKETMDGFTLRFSNFIFGNLILEKNNINYDKKQLLSALSRSNVTKSIVNSFGYVSLSKNNKSCSAKSQEEMFNKLRRLYPEAQAKLSRLDGSKIAILKVGDIIVSQDNKLDELLDQYLIASNSRLFLTYGNINFELLKTSAEYRYNVANILLGYKNLNSSRYIGSLVKSSIVKRDIPFRIGKTITSDIKFQMLKAL